MQDETPVRRPSPAMWLAWGLALLGGLLVILAAVLALANPCTQQGDCTADSLAVPGYLAIGGTVAAVVGGLASALQLVRRRR